MALKIAGIALLFDPLGLQAFDLPKSLWSRGTEWLLAGLLVLAIFRFGPQVVPRGRLHPAVVGYALAVAVSGLVGINTYVALHGEQDSYLGLAFVCDMLVLYFATAVALQNLADWRELTTAITVVGVVSSLYAIGQSLGADPIRWSVDSQIRPFGTFGNPNQLAHFLSVAAGISLGCALLERSPLIRLAYGSSTGLFVITSGLTGARAGFVGLGAIAIVALMILVRRQSHQIQRRVVLGAFVAAALALGLILFSPSGQRLLAGQFADRMLIYATSLRAFVDRPLLGYGPDQFEIAFVSHRPAGSSSILGQDLRPVWAHDWVLQSLVTTGLLGTAALVLTLLLGTTYLWTRGLIEAPHVAAPLLLGWVAYWSQALVTVSSISIDWFPWTALGVVAALARRPVMTTNRSFSALTRGALISVVLAGALTSLPALAANREARAARAFLELGTPGPSFDAARAAVQLDPGRSVYWNLLGIASETLERWDVAIHSYDQAVIRSDYVATYSLNAARTRAELGVAAMDSAARTEAFDAGRRALAIDPFDPAANRSFAEIARLLDECDEAFHSTLDAYSLSGGDKRYAVGLSADAACVRETDRARTDAMTTLAVGETSEIRAALAVLYLRAGDVASARANAIRALELDVSSPSALKVIESTGR